MKSLSIAQQSALDASHVVPVVFAQIDFASGNVQRYCTAGASIAWNGYTWLGTGGLVNIEPIRETGSIESVGLRLTMSGVPSTLVSLALQGEFQGRPVTLWLALLDANGALIGTPITEYAGRLDTMTIVDGADSATISVTVESEMASLMGASVRRHTDADHQKDYPGDKIFAFVAQMKERALPFPSGDALRRDAR
ncbi:MAG: hypothetical protein RL756_598 [Pseudomonadota bacterium]